MKNKGFTLIELLVVVGILGVLAIAALVAINPAEAQRRTRDSVRLKDLALIQSAVEAYINDNGTTGLASAADATTDKSAQVCDVNWLGVNLCNYIKSIPRDPLNGSTMNYIIGNVDPNLATRASGTARYRFIFTAATGEYEICSYLEGQVSAPKVAGDGGNNNIAFEVGTRPGVVVCTP